MKEINCSLRGCMAQHLFQGGGKGASIFIVLRCATNRRIAGSIPGGIIGVFFSNIILPIDSVSNRNEYQENFLGVNAAGA